ncbi:MAG TPA: hypothetical protein VFV68_01780 [Agriterribacter sp.]|nr:hypothetical protein [Agriterribacter sp.]
MANTRTIWLCTCIMPMLSFAQQRSKPASSRLSIFQQKYFSNDTLPLPCNAWWSVQDSVYYYFHFNEVVCKGSYFSKNAVGLHRMSIVDEGAPAHDIVDRGDFFHAVHGDVNYDFFYRSAVDTPFSENHIAQHSTHVNLYMVVRDIPVAIHLNARKTNSPLFKNYIDGNIEFNGLDYQSYLKERLKAKIIAKITQEAPDSMLRLGLQKNYAQQQLLQQWLHDGRQIQRLADSRQVIAAVNSKTGMPSYNKNLLAEKAKGYLENQCQEKLADTTGGADYTRWISKGANLSVAVKQITTLKNNNISEMTPTALNPRQQEAVAYAKDYLKKREQYQKLSGKVDSLEEKYNKAKTVTQHAIDSAQQAVDDLNDPAALQSQAEKYGLDSNKTYRHVKHLLAIRQFSIGRSMVNYSELSAKNISVTGINVEYNARYYYAIAAGTVDYRYRDFFVNHGTRVPQHLVLLRAGIGKKEGNHIIFTAYQGKKQTAGFSTNNRALANNLFGITIEGKYYLNQHNYIIAEAAKSSYPRNIRLQPGGGNHSKLSPLSDRTNEAYSVQLFTVIPATATRIYGQYKRIGANFQSFSIFNYNSGYAAWQLRADQAFFKRALQLSVSVKSNEYSSPYTIYNYKSNTIFKSVQAMLRLKKWPVISAGYMPTSQLSKSGSEIVETRFNMIMASANYMYRAYNNYMHSSVMYNRFFNDGNQRNFMYYNSTNWFFSHSVTGYRHTVNSAFSVSYSPGYRLVTIDEGLQCDIKTWLKAGAGLKLNRLNQNGVKPGCYGHTQLKLKKLGDVLMSFDHGFLPGMDGTLVPNDVVRIVYLKTF